MIGEILPVLYSADLSECAAVSQLTDAEMSETFALVLRRAGATILQAYTHAGAETGMTCVLILSESHAVLHTWPATGTVNVDIFSCSTRLNSRDAIHNLKQLLGARDARIQEVPRADGHPSSLHQSTLASRRA